MSDDRIRTLRGEYLQIHHRVLQIGGDEHPARRRELGELQPREEQIVRELRGLGANPYPSERVLRAGRAM